MIDSRLDPLGYALGQGAGGAIGFLMEKSDEEKWKAYMAAQQQGQQGPPAPQMSTNEMISPALGNFQSQSPLGQPPAGSGGMNFGQPASAPPLPRFLSPKWRGLGQMMAQQQMMGSLPPDAMTAARTDLYQAQADDVRRGPAPTKMSVQEQLHQYALQQGAMPGSPEYNRYTKGPTEPKVYQPELWENSTGRTKWVAPGTPPPEGYTPYKPTAEPSTNKLLARKMEQIEGSMAKLETAGKTDTEAYGTMQKRWDELAKLSSASTTLNINPASPTERTAIAEGASSIDALNNMKGLFEEVVSGSGIFAYPGPIKGPVASVMGAMEMAPAKQEEFRAATFTFKNAMIKAITGAQMSEPEAKRIMSQVPDIKDPPTRWRAKWRQSMKNIQEIQARRKQVLQQSGLAAPEMGVGQQRPDPLGIR